MEYTILLDKSESIRQVETEEQTRFILSIVESLDIPFEWDGSEEISVLERVRLRKTLGQYNVSVIDSMDGEVKIYLERDKIAEWNKSSYILKEDLSQIDPKKRLFIEMKCKCWSIFEEGKKEQSMQV